MSALAKPRLRDLPDVTPGFADGQALVWDEAAQRFVGGPGAAIAAHLADTSDAHDASAVSFSPTGGVAATDAQAAIAELDTEKLNTVEKAAASGVASLTAASRVVQSPKLHAADHAVGGADVLSPAQIGAQPADADLTAIAALSTVAFGRGLLEKADAAATKTALVLAKGDVGLGSVDNTADSAKPVSTAQQAALDAKAALVGPQLTGTPRVTNTAALKLEFWDGAQQVAALRSDNLNNVGLGRDALLSNTVTGVGSEGLYNTAAGQSALRSNTTGYQNTAVGQSALYSNTTGYQNTAVGQSALYSPAGITTNATTTGARQTALGMETGQASAAQRNDSVTVGYRALVDADNTVAVGSGAQALHSGAVAIGQGAVSTAADQVMVGGRDVEITLATKGQDGVEQMSRQSRQAPDPSAVADGSPDRVEELAPHRQSECEHLQAELDQLVAIDEQRNAHQAVLDGLQSERDMRVGRMQVVAEQAGVDLERWVADELTRRRHPGSAR